jgi:geranylgeranyl diphosphate synthase type I
LTEAAPPAAAQVATLVEARLSRLLDTEEKKWAGVLAEAAEPCHALRRLVLGGGKRIRAAFCYWAFVGAGGDRGDPRVIDACAVLELLHAAALIHDDVIDASEQRRGADSVHVAFARRHSARRWRGDAARFGEAAAVLVGNLAMGLAQRLVAAAGPAALAVLAEMWVEVNGQYLDLVGAAGEPDDRQDRARLISVYKTAKYTVERPLQLGIALAAPDRLGEIDEATDQLSAFALAVGKAFQLRDDILGVFGDPELTGKPAGADLASGKATLLVALARERLSGAPGGAALLEALSSQATPSEGEVAALQDAITSSGALAAVEMEIEKLLEEALGALRRLRLAPEALVALEALARYAVHRQR